MQADAPELAGDRFATVSKRLRNHRALVALLDAPLAKLVLWGVLSMLIYHILAGVKHLFLDFHVGDTFEAASASAYVVFGLTVLLAAATGVWLW